MERDTLMLTPRNVPRSYRFADLRLDPGQRQVWRGDVPLQLPKLTFATLHALVAMAPNVVSHDELAASVWGDARIVTPENIAQRVMMLRRCLGDSSADPRYIKGVRGHGYKLVPEVTVVPGQGVSQQAALPVPVELEEAVQALQGPLRCSVFLAIENEFSWLLIGRK